MVFPIVKKEDCPIAKLKSRRSSAKINGSPSPLLTNGVEGQSNGHINGHQRSLSSPIKINPNGHLVQPNREVFNDHGQDNQGSGSCDPMAIVGIALRLPGGVSSDEELWKFLDARREARCRVPEDRYNVDAFYGPGKSCHVATEYGYFLSEADFAAVDSSLWSLMTKKEIELMDPQQRLALEIVYECFQSSGCTDWKGSNAGVFMGTWGEDWADMHFREPQQSGPYRVTGFGDFTVPNRISYEFGLTGPSVLTGTACSSSLTSLHEACMAIQHGDCDSAIVGGTNLILNPFMTVAMSEQGVLSPDGRCKTFDEAANGYARGEGVVAIHIKKLSDAIQNNDPVRAVIRSSCINSDGKTAGLSVPNPASQELLMRKGHELAGIDDLSQTAMIECHGTGTPVGDPLETKEVASVFGEHGIYIGSIKPNFGHSEGASGILSIIKAVLALEKRQIPPNINFNSPSSKIPFEECKLVVPTTTTAWPQGKAERIGVNSFGIGGSNAQILLDSARQAGVDQSSRITNGSKQDAYLLTFSAGSSEALKANVETHLQYLLQHPDRAQDMSYTLNLRRRPLEYRAFCKVSPQDLHESPQPHIVAKPVEATSVSLIFTGQGAQYAQMAAQVLATNETFQDSILSMERALKRCPDPPSWSITEELLRPADESRLLIAEFSQPCCTALQIGLVDVLHTWSVEPVAVVAHSSGEIAAAYASGALSLPDAIKVAYYRGRAMRQVKGQTARGGMAAVGLGYDQVEPFLQPGVIVGCVNSPSSVTPSGDLDALSRTMDDIRVQHPDILVRALRVDCAYHSHHMKPLGPGYARSIDSISATGPSIPFFSSVTGGPLDSTPLDATYWAKNLTSPVLFSPAVSALLKSHPSTMLLEVGPHSALAGPVRQILQSEANSKSEYLSSLVRGIDATTAMLNCAGMLFAKGVPLDLTPISPRGRVLTDLPTYAWQREGVYWNESRLSTSLRLRQFGKHDLLGARIYETSDFHPTWRNLLRLDDIPWIRDHAISSDIIFPAAGYVAMAGEAARQLTQFADYTVRQVNLSSAMIMLEGTTIEVITDLKPTRVTNSLDSAWYDFEISSLTGDRWTKHVTGQVRGGRDYEQETPTVSPGVRQVSSDRWYKVMAQFGLKYGTRFQALRQISAEAIEHRAAATVTDFSDDHESFYSLHPSTIDCALQLASVAAFKGQARLFTRLAVPRYIEELYIKPTLQDIQLQASTSITTSGTFTGNVVGVSDDAGMVFQLTDLQTAPLADAADVRGDDPHAAVELVWKPDINFADPATLMHMPASPSPYYLQLERMALACMVDCSIFLQEKHPKESYLLKFQAWLNAKHAAARQGAYPGVDDDVQIATMSPAQRMELVESLYGEMEDSQFGGAAAAIRRVCSVVPDLFDGATDILDALMQDGVWTKIYTTAVFMVSYDSFLDLLAHSKPNLKILEIGAGTGGTTVQVLRDLENHPGYKDRRYLSYTYTDISPGFFGTAKERFSGHEGFEFKVLDITKDPMEQGFDLEGYNLIVAANVLHATPDLHLTLSNVRKLLAPTGRLVLQELSPYTKWINFVMGVLPGWWLGENDGRPDVREVFLNLIESTSSLKPSLTGGIITGTVHIPRRVGQTTQGGWVPGCLVSAHDGQFNANIISLPAQPQLLMRATVLVRDAECKAGGRVTALLAHQGYAVDVCTLGDRPPPGQHIISLLDVHKPLLKEIDAKAFEELKHFFESNNESPILWVSGAVHIRNRDPHYGMAVGMLRTLRRELDLKIGVLELESFDTAGFEATARVFYAFQQSPDRGPEVDREWAFLDGAIRTPRYHWISVNERLALSTPEVSSVKLNVARRGLLDSLQWTTAAAEEPKANEVVVKGQAVGLNFKDVLITMGIVEAAEHEQLGIECAGFVEQVGSDVKSFSPGDRCMIFGSGCFSSSVATWEDLCVVIPPELSFLEAASMPAVYCTVLYALYHKARLCQGESILIHSACGGVGIAAIQVCQYIGAEIFCTVGNEEKVQHLMETYKIPRERIFNSRDQTFRRDVLAYTKGRGVDVVLNSLSGELLHASWECVAQHGIMLEIGKRDFIGKGQLQMDLFEQNRSFVGIDIGQVAAQRPKIMKTLMNQILELYKKGAIKPIYPLIRYTGSEISDAMRFMQRGTHIGKVVVELEDELMGVQPHAGQAPLVLRPDASYILAGGLGGLGQAIAVWMAESGASEIVFLSRSAGDAEKYSSFIRELKEIGCHAVMIAGSVTDECDVALAFHSATKPVRGVMQASMVLKDVDFLDMAHEDWLTAVEPKVCGTWNLHSASIENRLDLDFFLLFSSWSGIMGQWRQANYAAGNMFLDAFTQYRRNQGLPCAAVNIGIMEDIGYVSRHAKVLEHFRTTATKLLQEQDLLDSLQLLINESKPSPEEITKQPRARDNGTNSFVNNGQLAIGIRSTIPLAGVNNRTLWSDDIRMAGYRNMETANETTALAGDEQLAHFLSNASANPDLLDDEEQIRWLATEIGKALLGLLMRDSRDLDVEQSLQAIGLDSLVAIEWRNWFKRKVGLDLTVLDILGSASVLELGRTCAGMLKQKYTATQ